MKFVRITDGPHEGRVGMLQGLSITVKTDADTSEILRHDLVSHEHIPSRNAICVRLYHGRHEPLESTHGWGEDGPVLGPLSDVVFTYGRPRLFVDNDWKDELKYEGDCIEYGGMYYGDMSISPIYEAWREGWKLTPVKEGGR